MDEILQKIQELWDRFTQHIHDGIDSSKVDYNNLLNVPAVATPIKYPVEITLNWSKPFTGIGYCAGIAFNSDSAPTRMMTPGDTDGFAFTFRNFAGNASDSWLSVGSLGVTDPMQGTSMCYHKGKFYASRSATTGITQLNDSDTPNTTNCTVSGTTLSNVNGLASDGTYLYSLDTSTTVKKFTVSGTVLTFVSTITLGHAITQGLVVTSTNIYGHDTGNPILTFYKFDLTGANVSNQTLQNNSAGFPVIKNAIKGPDGGLWLNCTSSSASGGQSIHVLKKFSY